MYSFLLFFLFQKENEMQSTMEEVFLRFPHLSENIFGSLKSEFLAKSKEVCRSWYDYLDDQKFLQIRADKVKLVIETVEKFGHIAKAHIADYKLPNITFEIETRKEIINDARNGNFDLVHGKIMNNIDSLYQGDQGGCCLSLCGLPLYVTQPIFMAAFHGHLEMVIYLVDNLEDKNPKNDDQWYCTPLHVAANHGRIDVVRYIMSNVLDINPKDNYKITPLHYATVGGRLDVVKYIMEKLEDKSPKCNSGNTPLHFAAFYGQLTVYKYIVENVVEKNPRNKNGYTPLDLAHERVYSEMHAICHQQIFEKFNELSLSK